MSCHPEQRAPLFRKLPGLSPGR